VQNLLNDLTLLLEQDNRLVAEGKLLKNKVVELALALDPGLIKLLLKHDAIRKHFFVEVEGVLVFDKIKFQRFVSNKQFLPDSYTAFKNKIGLTANGEYLTESKEVVLSWPYKDCVLEGGQDKEDAKRNCFMFEFCWFMPVQLALVFSFTAKSATPILNKNLAAVSSVLNSRVSRLVVSSGLPSAIIM